MIDLLSNLRSPILVTGCAGFIGFHLANRLLQDGIPVFGLDNLNDYYDVSIKNARLELLREHTSFRFLKQDLVDHAALENLFATEHFSCVVHLAAQAGVRYSLVNPRAYLDSNLIAYFNVLDISRRFKVSHLVYASSSSVYGLNSKMPFSIHDNVDHPISLYAASKKSNELLAHAYSHMFGLPTTGLRFFTAYGPWGRPDMALFKFSRSVFLGEPLTLYNYGKMQRDFTYIDDVVQGILGVLHHVPEPNPEWTGNHPDPGTSPSPYRVYNIGASRQVDLLHFLELIEIGIGKKAIVNLAPIQPGDIPASFADISDLARDTGYEPRVSVEEGVQRFLDWFLDYYGSGRPIPMSD
jgi:UDP-glucuronate 4-epimerase